MNQVKNGVDLKDKVVTEMPAHKKESKEFLTTNAESWKLMSTYKRDGVVFISESMMVDQIGCLHRDTIVYDGKSSVTTCFVEGVRLVPQSGKDNLPDGYMYIGKNVRLTTDAPTWGKR